MSAAAKLSALGKRKIDRRRQDAPVVSTPSI